MSEMYKVDLVRFRMLRGKRCPCLVDNEANNIPENDCPCNTFVETGECRCMLFKKIE